MLHPTHAAMAVAWLLGCWMAYRLHLRFRLTAVRKCDQITINLVTGRVVVDREIVVDPVSADAEIRQSAVEMWPKHDDATIVVVRLDTAREIHFAPKTCTVLWMGRDGHTHRRDTHHGEA